MGVTGRVDIANLTAKYPSNGYGAKWLAPPDRERARKTLPTR
jgi:hypothetical protein